MAFTGNLKRSAISEDVPVKNEFDEDSGLNFLNPKKDAVVDSLHDAFLANSTIKSAHQYTLKTLNALKIVSPILTALMYRPGVDGNTQEVSESFRLLIKEISKASADVCEKLELDPNVEKNFWIRNVIEKHLAEYIKNQWIDKGEIDTTDFIKNINNVVEFSKDVAEKNEYVEFAALETLKIANIKAMNPILQESQLHFDLYRNLEEDLEPIMEKLFHVSKVATDKLADPYADSKSRAALFSIIIQEAGQLYANAWHTEAKRVKAVMDAYPKDKLEKVLEKYKSTGGLPLTKIEHDFDKYFDKMIIITDKLINSNKSGIDKKLKK